MELADFDNINPMTKDFRGLSITFNPDAFTEAFFFAVAERFRSDFAAEVRSAVESQNKELQVLAEKLPDEARPVMQLANNIADGIKFLGETLASEKSNYVALLAGMPNAPVLLAWDLTDKGVPVPCNEEGLKTLRHRTLKDLWQFVRDAANPKSRGIETIPQNQTTNENTQSPSATPATPVDESRLM